MNTDTPVKVQVPSVSVLRSWKIRTLPVALAQRMAATAPGDPYMVTLNRLFMALPRTQRTEYLFEIIKVRDDRSQK